MAEFNETAFPAKAGTHLSADRAVQKWVPAFAGNAKFVFDRTYHKIAPFRLARRLIRTHAFRLAGLYLLVFALSVIGVLFFVYWARADFVPRQTEATLDAEISSLAG